MRELRVIPVLIEDENKFTSVKLNELLFKCIRNETVRVSGVLNAFFSLNYKILIAVVIKSIGLGREEWKISGIFRDEKGFKLITKKSEQQVSFEDQTKAEEGFKKRIDNIYNDVTDIGFESIFKALTAVGIMDEKVMEQLPGMMMEIGFGRTFYTRAPVDRLIKTIKKSITDGTKLNFNPSQLMNFSNVLVGSDFIPLITGESDIRLKVFSVLRILKVNNFAQFDEDVNERIKKFVKDNRESFAEDVGQINELLEKDPRDQILDRSLTVSSQERIDFLYGIGLFDPPQVKFEDLPEVLNLKNSMNVLPTLKAQRDFLNKRIQNLRDNGIFNIEFVTSVNELSNLQRSINYNIILEDSKAPLNIQDFLITYSKATEEGKYLHDEKTIKDLLFYVDHSKLEEPEALAILSIFSSSLNDDFEDIPKNILNAIIHNEHHMKVITFGSKKTLTKPKNFCNFMMKIFVINENKSIYRTVLRVCRKYQDNLEETQQLIVDVEEEMRDLFAYIDLYKNATFERTLGLIEAIHNLIDAKQMVTQNMFRFFENNLKYEEIFALLEKVVLISIQNIPKFLLKKITEVLNQKIQVSKYSVGLVELLIRRNFIKCSSLEKFLMHVVSSDDHVIQSKALEAVHSALEGGQDVPQTLLSEIGKLPLRKGIFNLVKKISDPDSKFLILIDPKTSDEQKIDALRRINPIDYSKEIVNILIDFIIYSRLNLEALKTFLRVIPDGFSFDGYDINVLDIILCTINSNLDYPTLQTLLTKTNTDIGVVISSLDDENREKIQSLIFGIKRESPIDFLDVENFDEFSKFLEEKIKLKEMVTFNETMLLIHGLKNENLIGPFSSMIAELLKKINDEQTLDYDCYRELLRFLIVNTTHEAFDELLKNLSAEDQSIVEGVKSDASSELIKIIDMLIEDPQNDKALMILGILWKDIKEDHVTKLREFCLTNVELKVKLKMLKLLSIYPDDDFTKNILDEMLKNFKSSIEEFTNKLSSPEKFSLALAIGYANAYNIPLDEDIFSDSPQNWAFNILCRTLFTFVATDLESDFTPIIDSLDIFRFNFNGETIGLITKPNVKIEDMLMMLLDKINGEFIAANFLQDILVMISSNLEVYENFSNDTSTWQNISFLRQFWLTVELSNAFKAIEIDEIKKLMIMLEFHPSTVMMLLERVNITIDPEEVLKIFELLKSSGMPREQKDKILNDLQGYPCHEWFTTVISHVVYRVLQISLKYFENATEEYEKLSYELQRLCEIGWSEVGLANLVEKIQSKADMQRMCTPIRLLYEFKIKEFNQNLKDQNVIEIIQKTNWKDLENNIYDLAIKNSFEGTQEKDLEKLNQELKAFNQSTEIKYLLSEKVIEDYKKVVEVLAGNSEIIKTDNPINEWNKTQINMWSQMHRYGTVASSDSIEGLLYRTFSNITRPKVSAYEEIAVTMQAVYLTKGYYPRAIQVLSLLLLLNPEEGKGRLMQINTGEGKTMIVAMLAVIKALAGHKVDVVTSSSELAKPQSRELEDFYKIFGLTTSHNGEDPVDKSVRYKCDIVYGAASDFQADILREEYSMESTKSGRKSDLVIVDEADSMLIDGRNYIVMLSSQMPAMNYLEGILATIWCIIHQYIPHIIERDGGFYYVDKNTDANEAGKITVEGDDNAIKIELNKFIKENLMKTMRKILTGEVTKVEIESNNDKPDEKTQPLAVPTHLKDYILNHQLEMWVDSAIYAQFFSKEGKNYILDVENGNKIVPVDSDNTGVLQQSMHWSNGLHQFLQFKHGTKLVPESITTNFISNVEFFKRYEHRIFGMTGTLGSVRSKYFLQKTYNVDSIIVPQFKVKRYKELSAVITFDDDEWYNEIVESNMRHLARNRAVLIITKYIKEAEELQKRFEKRHLKEKVKVYKTDYDSAVVRGKVESGDIIIATNIAGRGTDIKTSYNVEDFGGLHVCVTFLPPNERVEHQNIGRTARTGNRGTGQFIVIEKKIPNMEKLKVLRNFMEEQEINEAENQINATIIKDAVFKEFCKLLVYANDEYERKAIEERFGMWLQINSDKSKDLQIDFIIFKNEIREDLKNSCVIKNPNYYIQRGNKFLDNNAHDEAIGNFTKAIEVDDEFAENAYYNRAIARLKKYCGSVNNNKDKIQNVLDDFIEARKRLKNRETELNVIMQANAMERGNILSEQITRKLVMLNIQKNAIEEAIGMSDEDYEQQINALNEGIKQKKSDEEKNELENQKKQFEESNPKNGVIQKVLDNGHNLKFELFSIKKSFPADQNVKLFDDEILEFAINGFMGKFEISEIIPINWGDFFAVFFIGIAQFVAGALLVVFTVGAGVTIGKALMSEGISDMITAVKDCLINRDFSWASYGLQKAISICATILTAGIDGLKDAAKAALAGTKGIVKTAVTQVTKNGLKMALKIAGIAVLTEITQELVLPAINYLLDKVVMENFKKLIHQKLIPLVKEWLEAISIVAKMFALDMINKNLYYTSKIIDTVRIILYEMSQKNEWQQFILGVAQNVISQNIGGKIIWESATMVNDVIKIFHTVKIRIADKLYHNFDKQVADEEKMLNENASKPSEKQAISTTKPHSSKEEAYVTVADDVSNSIVASINQSIVKPLTSSFVNKGLDRMYGNLQKSVDKQLENYKSQRRIIFTQNQDFSRLPSQYKMSNLNDDQKEALRKQANADIDDFKSGSMVGIQHMGSVADAVERPIKVLNKNGKTIAVFGDENGGEPLEVQYHEPGSKYPKGHYTLRDGKDPPTKFNTYGENDCLFNVLAHQTDVTDPNKIRQNAAEAMKKNIDYQAMQYDDVERLRRLKPKALIEGGMNDINVVHHINTIKHLRDKNVLLRDDEGYHLDPSAMAGTYGRLTQFSKNEAIEINHTPPKAVMGEDENDLPCITMLASDHRLRQDIQENFKLRMTSTGGPGVPAYYRICLKSLLGDKGGEKYFKSDKFADALVPELIDHQLVSMVNRSCNYKPAMYAFIDHCVSEKRLDHSDATRLRDLIKDFPTPVGDFDKTTLTKNVNDFKDNMKTKYLKDLDLKNINIEYNLRDIFDQRVAIGLELIKDVKIKPSKIDIANPAENHEQGYPFRKRPRGS